MTSERVSTRNGGAAIVTTDVTYRGNVSDPGDNLTETITTNSTAGGSTLVNSFAYSYDANKNKLKETIGGPLNPYGFGTTVGQEAAYDAEDRLTDWHRDDTLRDLNYALSKVGDWNTFTVEGVTETRTHGNAHELTNLAGGANPGALTHDAKGNILTSPAHGSQTYTWDFDNQLKQAVIGGTHKYYYDALGRRVMKHVAGENRLIFVHDGQQIIAEYKYTNGVIGIPGGIDAGASTTSQSSQTQSNAAVVIGTRRGAATIQRKYVYCTYIDERCLMIDRTTKGALPAGTEELFYYHTNNLYSVAAMTDAAGLITERYAYDAYGNIIFLNAVGVPLGTQASTIGQPYTYTGRRLDDETGLYQYRFRYYDAALGRFLGRDRILYGDGYNMYAYVGGRPLIMLDPIGAVKIKKGDVLDVIVDGKKVGTAKIDKYEKAKFLTQTGATLVVSVNITDKPGVCGKNKFRWRQHFTMKDQKGRFQEWQGKKANNLLDPEPNDDDKDWYWTNAEWETKKSADGRSATFEDSAMTKLARLDAKGITRIDNLFSLELVMVPNLAAKKGGKSVLTIDWGYVSTKASDKLIER